MYVCSSRLRQTVKLNIVLYRHSHVHDFAFLCSTILPTFWCSTRKASKSAAPRFCALMCRTQKASRTRSMVGWCEWGGRLLTVWTASIHWDTELPRGSVSARHYCKKASCKSRDRREQQRRLEVSEECRLNSACFWVSVFEFFTVTVDRNLLFKVLTVSLFFRQRFSVSSCMKIRMLGELNDFWSAAH